jgi:hypothetical protein
LAGRRARPSPIHDLRGAASTRVSRLSHIDRPSGIPVRFERARPWELLHLDVKKLGRIPPGGAHRMRGAARRPIGSGSVIVRVTTTSTSPWTTTPWWPSSASSPTNRARRRRGSCWRPPGSSPIGAFASSGSSPIATTPTGCLGPFTGARADRCPPQAHPRLPHPDQRQGRTIHPDHARRVGLRPALPVQRGMPEALPASIDLYNSRRPIAWEATRRWRGSRQT